MQQPDATAIEQLLIAALQANDCSWLYFDSQLLEPILAGILKRPHDAHQLPYIMAAFLDAQKLLAHAPGPADQADSSLLAQVRHLLPIDCVSLSLA